MNQEQRESAYLFAVERLESARRLHELAQSCRASAELLERTAALDYIRCRIAVPPLPAGTARASFREAMQNLRNAIASEKERAAAYDLARANFDDTRSWLYS